MNRTDALPNCICTDCWKKVGDFHRFHRSILSAQEEYLKRSVKLEIEQENVRLPNFVEVITNCDEYNVFADETIKASSAFDDIQEIKPHHVDGIVLDIENEIDVIHEGKEEEGEDEACKEEDAYCVNENNDDNYDQDEDDSTKIENDAGIINFIAFYFNIK